MEDEYTAVILLTFSLVAAILVPIWLIDRSRRRHDAEVEVRRAEAALRAEQRASARQHAIRDVANTRAAPRPQSAPTAQRAAADTHRARAEDSRRRSADADAPAPVSFIQQEAMDWPAPSRSSSHCSPSHDSDSGSSLSSSCGDSSYSSSDSGSCSSSCD